LNEEFANYEEIEIGIDKKGNRTDGKIMNSVEMKNAWKK
jgi:hypothetical protein